jgi:hypothetical protein
VEVLHFGTVCQRRRPFYNCEDDEVTSPTMGVEWLGFGCRERDVSVGMIAGGELK